MRVNRTTAVLVAGACVVAGAVVVPMAVGAAEPVTADVVVLEALDGRREPAINPASGRTPIAHPAQQVVTVTCQVNGEPYAGSTVWLKSVDGGWVPGAYVRGTGADGALPQLPPCEAAPAPAPSAPVPGLSAEQAANARTIVGVVQSRGLPRRAAVLAIATAMVESDLDNDVCCDHDSRGLFQQRPSMGWGTVEQVLDPVYATNAFLNALVKIPGWETLPNGVAEQRVQRSAFPERYGPRHAEAEPVVTALWTVPATV